MRRKHSRKKKNSDNRKWWKGVGVVVSKEKDTKCAEGRGHLEWGASNDLVLNVEWWSAIPEGDGISQVVLLLLGEMWGPASTQFTSSCTLSLQYSVQRELPKLDWLPCEQQACFLLNVPRKPLWDAYIAGDVAHVAAVEHVGCVRHRDHVALHLEEVWFVNQLQGENAHKHIN